MSHQEWNDWQTTNEWSNPQGGEWIDPNSPPAIYAARMKTLKRRVVKVSTKVMPVQKWTSCLKDFNEILGNNMRHEVPHCSRTIKTDSGILHNTSRPSHRNQKWTDDIRQRLVNRIQNVVRPVNWMSNALLYPLGPQNIRRIQDFNIRMPQGYQFKLLVKNSVAHLAVSLRESKEAAIKVIEDSLCHSKIKNEHLTLSELNSGDAMLLEKGKAPILVKKPSESQFLVIFDQFNGRGSSIQYYENLLRCQLLSCRSLSDPEKRFIEKRQKRFDLRNRSMRILEFSSPEDKARCAKLLESIDIIYAESMFNFNDFHESVNLYVSYDHVPQNNFGVSVTLSNERDKEIAERIFRDHGLNCDYFKNHKRDYELKYQENIKTMFLDTFPLHVKNIDDRINFIKKIIEVNNLEVEKIAVYEERIRGAMKTCLEARKADTVKIIEKGLIRYGRDFAIYAPDDELENYKNREDVPWMVTSRKTGNKDQCTISFRTFEIGMAFIVPMLRESYFNPIFKVDMKDIHGPTLTPCYRKSLSVSIEVRTSLNNQLHELDKAIRETFPSLHSNEDPMMEADEARYYVARLFDEWQEGGVIGILGIMGWNKNIIDYFCIKLLEILTPMTFETKQQPELLYGIGEVFVKSLKKKYDGALVIEVDKFNERINLIGDAAGKALKDLQDYRKNSEDIRAFVEIPVHFPFYNPGLKEFIHPVALEDLRKSIGIDYLYFDRKNQKIQFEGNVKGYEELMRILEEMNEKLFEKETENRVGDAPSDACTTCWSDICSSTDFYRFNCGHLMCRTCANNKIRNLKDTNVTCDLDGCGAHVAPSEIMHVILGGPNRIRDLDSMKITEFTRITKNYMMSQNEALKACPTPNCNGIRCPSEGMEDNKSCNSCGKEYCSKCAEEPHPEVTCDEFRALQQPDHSMSAYIKSVGAEKVKQCPKCSVFVEKIDGCNHMECSKCGLHFCWVCLFYEEGTGSQKVYAHLTEVHGGNGLQGVGNFEQFEDADNEMQRIIEMQFGRVNRQFVPQRQLWEDMARIMLEPINPFEEPPMAPPTPPPPPPIVYYTLPEIIAPFVVRNDEELYLEYINGAATLEEQQERLQRALDSFTR